MWFDPTLSSRWKNMETVLKCRGQDKKTKQTKKNARITVVFHSESIQHIVILSFYRNSTLSRKASQHSSTELPAPSQWIFFLVLNTILFEATQHPLKPVPRDPNFKEIVYTSAQQQSLQTVSW